MCVCVCTTKLNETIDNNDNSNGSRNRKLNRKCITESALWLFSYPWKMYVHITWHAFIWNMHGEWTMHSFFHCVCNVGLSITVYISFSLAPLIDYESIKSDRFETNDFCLLYVCECFDLNKNEII